MIISRKSEIKRLKQAYLSKEAELIVIYGRRRVGKTFLIRSLFEAENCRFLVCTGSKKGLLKAQLKHFAEAVTKTFTAGINVKVPESWDEAFKLLTLLIEQNQNEKVVIFLDELPWLASRKSGVLDSLDYYWNQYWSRNPKIKLIACGSSASWLIKKIIYNKGGLHNRCTCELKLDPFTLAEVDEYLVSRNIKLNKKHVLELYMAPGGIPYYLKYVEKGLSAHENTQNILFSKQAPLKDEFKKLFDSLFSNAKAYIELVQLIAQRKEGLSRTLLEVQSKKSSGGGRLSGRLNQLKQTNFIESYVSWNKEKGEYYKVIDEFSIFYLSWFQTSKSGHFTEDHWLKQTVKAQYETWSGYAFEAICHKHVNQIINALNLKTAEKISSWRHFPKENNDKGAQIDLLIDRSDDAITLCEIKYTDKPFVVTRQYAANIMQKEQCFKDQTKTNKHLFNALISANGIKQNQYSLTAFDNVVTLEDLFK